jgi:hypothetical protein
MDANGKEKIRMAMRFLETIHQDLANSAASKEIEAEFSEVAMIAFNTDAARRQQTILTVSLPADPLAAHPSRWINTGASSQLARLTALTLASVACQQRSRARLAKLLSRHVRKNATRGRACRAWYVVGGRTLGIIGFSTDPVDGWVMWPLGIRARQVASDHGLGRRASGLFLSRCRQSTPTNTTLSPLALLQ